MTSPSAMSSLFFGLATYFDLVLPGFSGVASLCNELNDILEALANEPRREPDGPTTLGASDKPEDMRRDEETDDLPLDITDDALEAILEVR